MGPESRIHFKSFETTISNEHPTGSNIKVGSVNPCRVSLRRVLNSFLDWAAYLHGIPMIIPRPNNRQIIM